MFAALRCDESELLYDSISATPDFVRVKRVTLIDQKEILNQKSKDHQIIRTLTC